MSLDLKAAAWKLKHADAAKRIDAYVRQKLGIPYRSQSEFALKQVDEWTVGFLAAMLDWRNAEPPPATPDAEFRAAAIQTLDLKETP